MQKAPIRLVHALGTHCRDTGALLLDEETVLHRTGRWLVSQPIANGAALPKLTFVYELDPKVVRLTAVCISENRKYIALCEQCEASASGPPPPPQLRVINVQARRTICVLSGALEGAFVGCTFSSDSKHVLAYTGEPDHVTVVWQFSEERPVGMHKSRLPLRRVLFNPWMGSLISLSAPLRLARLNDQGHFKEIEVTALKRYGANAVDHAWLAAKQLVFIDGSGALRVIEESVLRQTIQIKQNASQPTTLTRLERGFAAGCADGDVSRRTLPPLPLRGSRLCTPLVLSRSLPLLPLLLLPVAAAIPLLCKLCPLRRTSALFAAPLRRTSSPHLCAAPLRRTSAPHLRAAPPRCTSPSPRCSCPHPALLTQLSSPNSPPLPLRALASALASLSCSSS